MDLSPIYPGSVPNLLASNRLTQTLQDATAQLTQMGDQLSSGHQFALPSDSPTAAMTTIGLQQLLEQKTQMLTNTQTEQAFMGATDNAMATISSVLNQAQQLISSGIGSTSSPSQKDALAQQAKSLEQELVNVGNTQFNGRYLFGGSQTTNPPFTMNANNTVTYNGDQQNLNSFMDLGQLVGVNVDGNAAFGALTPPIGSDLNPALTAQTQLSDLAGGAGVPMGKISVALAGGSSPQTATVDLSSAKTVSDVENMIAAAFPPGSVTVGLNAAQNGLTISAASGTVAVADLNGGATARDLGLAGAAAAQIIGGDLNPALTLTTPLSALNGGTGIGATAGKGLVITNGGVTKTVDISSATTVQDLVNILKDPSLNLAVGLNTAGNGLAISSRLSGTSFSIGENGGNNATLLGIRTMTGATPLSQLNLGVGVPINATDPIQITRRSGAVVSLDLTGATTVQDALIKINSIDPGNLTATLNAVGNGISITDNSGTGPLTVQAGATANALGIAGTEAGSNPAVPLVGTDVNPGEAPGVFNILIKAQAALQTQNDAELTRLGGLLQPALTQVSTAQSDLGAKEQMLSTVQTNLQNQQTQINQSISTNYDTNFTQVITQLVTEQTSYEATLKSAATVMQLSLYNYL